MSFPYTLDLAFGSEKATVDSFGRVSFVKLEDNKDYNYKTKNFIVSNFSPAPEYYYYIEITPTSEDVKKEVYTALNNAKFSIVIVNDKLRACTIKIEYTDGEYSYLASSIVSTSTSTMVSLTIPSTKSLTLNKKPVGDTTQTPIATLSLHLKNASDGSDVTENTVSASVSVSPQPLIKIPV